MYTDSGHYMEDLIKATLEHRRVGDLDNNMRHFISCLFGVVDENATIEVNKPDEPLKPDLFIRIGNEERDVSIKTGGATQFHSENIKTFILFLRSIGISEQTQRTILYYHFGDGTMDGSGKKRYRVDLLIIKMANAIKEANAELNANFDIIKRITDRIIYQGVDPSSKRATHIYHGDMEFGVTVSERQIDKWMSNRTWRYSKYIHIGPFVLRPEARYVDKPIRSDYKRRHVNAIWINAEADIRLISQRYNG